MPLLFSPHTLTSPAGGLTLPNRLVVAPMCQYASADGLADDLQHCLHQLAQTGSIAPFALCSTDLGSQFLLPERLYGRARETAELTQVWHRALAGELPEMPAPPPMAAVLPPGRLTIAVNTGDDFEHLGLTICPDIDSVVYALAGLNDTVRGWGVRYVVSSFTRNARPTIRPQ